MRLFEHLDIDFLGKRRLFYFVSGGLILLGLLSLFIRGLQFGIDFKGGTEIAVEFQKPVDITDIRNEVSKIGLGNVEVKTFGGSKGILVRTELQEIPRAIYPQMLNTIEGIIDQNFPGAAPIDITTPSNHHPRP